MSELCFKLKTVIVTIINSIIFSISIISISVTIVIVVITVIFFLICTGSGQND